MTQPRRVDVPPKKLVAIKLRSMGDTVLMTAALHELRRAYPETEIHVVVTSPWASLLEGHPAVNKIWKYDRHKETTARAKAIARLALELRREKFDVAVNFHASPSSAMLTFGTGARVRSIHFHGHNDKNRYSTVIIPGKGILKPVIERDMDTIRALNLHVPAGRLPQLFLAPAELRTAENRIQSMGLRSPLLMLGLGASRETKRWPIERFAALALEWAQKKKGSVIGIAGSDETLLSREFLSAVDDVMTATVPDTAARAEIRAQITCETGVPLRQLAALLSKAALIAGNDSGPRHLAVSVGTPSVTLFGPEDPFEWHPYPIEQHPFLYIEHLKCRTSGQRGFKPWCGLDVCTDEQLKCMRMHGLQNIFELCEKVSKKI